MGYTRNSKEFKKAQKKLTNIIRRYNRTIEEDTLWRGRFYMKQVYTNWHPYFDGSGGTMIVVIRCYDKKRRLYEDYVYDYIDLPLVYWHVSMDILNDFIIEEIKVWDEEEDPYKDTVDYRKVAKVKDKTFTLKNYEMGLRKGE